MKSRPSTWPGCRSWCSMVGQKDCTSWSWKPDPNTQSLQPLSSRRAGDLGSNWEQTADQVSGECQLFTTSHVELSFEAITQGIDCPDADLMSSDLPWDTEVVMADLILSVLPLVHVELPPSLRRRSMRRLRNVKFAFDSRVCMLTSGSASGHELKYGISQKLIRVLFAPPTPQVRIEAAHRGAHSSPSDVVRRFNSALAEYLQVLVTRYRILEKSRVPHRHINAIQIAKYNRIRSRLEQFSAASFFEHMTVLNPSGSINPQLLAFPVSSPDWQSLQHP